ncbi:MAG: hypothetical protein JF593_03205 [Novosphingobium sp.]|nr:hypothetical protein [Novosphingobium sp.]
MRYTPAALALSLLFAVGASTLYSAPAAAPPDPRASALLGQGQGALAAGQVEVAIDDFEAALAIAPGNPAVLLALADASRHEGLQGKALHYYREVLERDPQNLAAISGEGAALAEKGAVEKAKRNLARLQGLCGESCDATRQLAAAIARGPAPRMVSADAVKPAPVVSAD